jgi:hypothetical protein
LTSSFDKLAKSQISLKSKLMNSVVKDFPAYDASFDESDIKLAFSA